MKRNNSFLMLAAVLACGQTASAQKAAYWRSFRASDGLPESACMAVTFSPQGRILARHLTVMSVSLFDGYTNTVIPAPEGPPSRVFQSPGGQLWAFNLAGLQEYRNGAWVTHAGPGAAIQPQSPLPLVPIRQGLVLCLLRDKLIEYNAESPEGSHARVLRAAAQTSLEAFSGLCAARDGGLWIAGRRGLAKIPGPLRSVKPETAWSEFLLPANLGLEDVQEVTEDTQGRITALAQSTLTALKTAVTFDGTNWKTFDTKGEKLRRAWRGPDGSLWVATMDTLYEYDEDSGRMTENQDLSPRRYYDVAVEPSGAFWLATSEGLLRYALPLWRTPANLWRFNVRGLASDSRGRTWFLAGNQLHRLADDRDDQYPFPTALSRTLQNAYGIVPLKDGTLVLAASQYGLGEEDQGHGGDVLYRFDPSTGGFRALSPPGAGRLRYLGSPVEGTFLAALRSGEAGGDPPRILSSDGATFTLLAAAAPISAIGTNLTAGFLAQSGDLWVGAELGVAVFRSNKWRVFVSASRSGPAEAIGFIEHPERRVWCATRSEIRELSGEDWHVVRGGFDRLTALMLARDGSVWAASDAGVHRYYRGAWIDQSVEDGLPVPNILALNQDARERLWAASSQGLSVYHPEADPDAPRTILREASDLRVPEGEAVVIGFDGHDRWKFTSWRRLLYSWRLDQKDYPFQELNSARFADLSAGKHYFSVQAMDRNGNIDQSPARLEFIVALPWYKESRLVFIGIVGAAVALFFAGLAVNRHRRLLRSYAEVERKVEERSRQLELANRELLHSQKMNALGTLAAGIAHDFNNILSIIKGSAQLIEENPGNVEKVGLRVQRINTVVEQGAGIVKAMLGFSRATDQQPGPCDLNAIVSETLKLLGDRFLCEVQVSFQPASGLGTVVACPEFVQQILLNMIFNSAEAMARDKRIILATAVMPTPAVGLVLTPSGEEPHAALSVTDFGCGISPENLPRIFEPFFTTKALSTRRGTGLGLSMAYELAKKMGAGLAVQSAVGQGSTFTLLLPLSQEATSSVGNPKPSDPPPVSQHP